MSLKSFLIIKSIFLKGKEVGQIPLFNYCIFIRV